MIPDSIAELYLFGLAIFVWWIWQEPKGGRPIKPE